jgi:hypothetical protein
MNDDMKNRFQKHDNAKKGRHVAAAKTAEEREAARQEQRSQWLNHNRGTSSGVASTTLDPATLAARNAYLAEKEAAKAASTTEAPQGTPLTALEEGILAREWANSHPDWYASDYNVSIFVAIMDVFQFPKTWAGFSQAFDYGVLHNHFEPGTRKRGQPAPVPFVPPTPQAPEPIRSGNRPVRIESAISAEENRKLHEMPFDELQKQARSGMRLGYDAGRGY